MNKRAVYKIFTFAITPVLCTALFIVPVYAESDIYYPPEYSYSAYQYFMNNGYSDLILSTSGTTTYNVSLDNIGTNNGSITGTDDLSGSAHNTGTINSNGSSTLGAKYMVCSTNNGTSSSQTYSCYFSNRSSGVSNSQSINIGFNENTYSNYGNVDVNVNETINQSINTDITGTITASAGTSHYEKMPWLKGSSYYPSPGYSGAKQFYINTDYAKDFYFIFYTKTSIGFDDSAWDIYKNPSAQVTYSRDTRYYAYAGLILNIYHVHCDSGYGSLSLTINNLNNADVLPVFYGYASNMPDNVALTAGLRKSTNDILQNGNDNTSSIVDSADTAHNTVNEKINSFDQLENNQVNDMESKINDINVQSDLMSNNNFLSSAQWVKTQFDRMTVSTPIGSVLSFSLILGLALIFLGKIR